MLLSQHTQLHHRGCMRSDVTAFDEVFPIHADAFQHRRDFFFIQFQKRQQTFQKRKFQLLGRQPCIPNASFSKNSANCKCKLDTCTVELSESERRSGWKPLASVLGDAAAAFGCVNRVEELVKQFLRGAVAQLLARASVQLISSRQDVLWREGFNGGTLGHEGSEQPVVTFVLGTFPRGVQDEKADREPGRKPGNLPQCP